MKFLVHKISILLLLLIGAFDSASSNNVDIFQEGIHLYQKADSIKIEDADSANIIYGRAASRFEFLAQKEEVTNGWLYYNLGNTYFMMGEIGKAIYNYRRAEKYLFGNKDLNNNLNYAKTFVQDTYDKNVKSGYHDLIDQVKSIPSWIKILIFVLLYGSFWLLISHPLKKRITPFYKWPVLAILIPVTFILLLSITDNRKHGVILKDGIIAKKGNSLVYEDAFYGGLHQGTEFTLKEQRDNWLKIELIDGKIGWIDASDAGIIE